MQTPKLSVIVIAYKMPKQLLNTLYTLSSKYQRNIDENDYEVIVVENSSSDNVDESKIAELGNNFRFFRRDETSPSPVFSTNFAFSQCRAPYVGLIVDGARMITPRTLHYALMAYRACEGAVTLAPGYHLGSVQHHDHQDPVQALAEEQQLLGSVDWREDGYRLFDISTFSGANIRGYLQPIMECNCIFASYERFEQIGFANETFTTPGGGAINLHMYRCLALQEGSAIFILPGEGSFHQFHGGVTTSSYEERQAEIERIEKHMHSFWQPEGFKAIRREPILLGAVTHPAQRYLCDSLDFAKTRYGRIEYQGGQLWEDDDMLGVS